MGNAVLLLAAFVTGLAVFYSLDSFLRTNTRRSASSADSRKGTMWYKVSVGLVLSLAIYFQALILTDQFQYEYIASYSSLELGIGYKFSVFWAGQEGSFLFWLLCHVLFGYLLTRKKDDLPAADLAIYSMIQLGLLAALMVKSPFTVLDKIPGNGTGLNPLLQDPWMIIHPPIVFIGYAAMAVPFSQALGALFANRHFDWMRRALPWGIFAWCMLGAGIFVGGFWAYKVFGWGGYWAWDPVENASLVPWLFVGSFIHTLLAARKNTASIRYAYIGALASFLLVIYGTFLTRSGVLSNFSTHSFANQGVGSTIAWILLVLAILSVWGLALRWRGLSAETGAIRLKSREGMTLIGALMLSLLAAIVFVGMSTPLITMLTGTPQSVSSSFYNTMTLPITAGLLTVLITGTLFKWGDSNTNILKKYWWLVVVGHGVLAASIFFGLKNPMAAALAGLSFILLMTSLQALWLRLISMAAGIGHIGVALLLLGIVFSSTAGQSTMVTLTPSTGVDAFGTHISYKGTTPWSENKGLFHNFSIGDTQEQALTKLNANGQVAAREPAISRGFLRDLYLAPVMKHEAQVGEQVTLEKGQQVSASGLQVKFSHFTMAKDDDGANRLSAVIEVSHNGNAETVSPQIVANGSEFKPVPVKALGKYQIMLTSVNTSQGKIAIGIKDQTHTEHAIDVEISEKPLIILVWLGALLITIGSAAATWKRYIHSRVQTVTGKAVSIRQ